VPAPTPRITLFTGPDCAYCRQAKAFLRQRGIPFAERDIARSRSAFEEFHRLRGRGVPLILIGHRKIAGFDPGRLEQALNEAGFTIRKTRPKRKGRS
jgi:glutaredoxin